MLNIKCFTFNLLQEHTYLIYDETKKCAVIDPGCYEIHEQQQLSDFIQTQGLQVTHLINTHCHIDHILGNQYIKNTYGVKLAIHPQEITNLELAPTYALHYGIVDYKPTEPNLFMEAGDSILLGNTILKILHVPGHSPGHVALYSQKDEICLVGDVLFKGYIGRTDLPGGDYDILLDSIHKKLFTLNNQVTIYPGHGPSTTLGAEKAYNPFLKP